MRREHMESPTECFQIYNWFWAQKNNFEDFSILIVFVCKYIFKRKATIYSCPMLKHSTPRLKKVARTFSAQFLDIPK